MNLIVEDYTGTGEHICASASGGSRCDICFGPLRPRLAWNAIVRNETAVIQRCAASLLPHIDGAIIVDTGSTDDTMEILRDLFHVAGKPLEIHQAPFIDFAQARNVALKKARDSQLGWDYLLLADADMEFKVTQEKWLNGEKGPAYDLRQTNGAVGYYNRRLVSRHAQGWYVGVTHEYLDIPGAGVIDGAEFFDHGDGANRGEKYARDIALLEVALQTETNPGLIQRYHFYLAGTYFDMGNFPKAAKHYSIRSRLGGFPEEVWNSQMRYAMCQRQMGDSESFLWEMLQVYRARPTRVEPLYELARFYRDRGENEISLLFSSAGMQLPHTPNEQLFVNDWMHKFGIKEEFAICAYYNDRYRKQGAKVCDELVLAGSGQARGNQYWYLEPLVNYVPSFQPVKIPFDPPEGWVAMNPSVINRNVNGVDVPIILVRTVNYWITPEGQYAIRGIDGSYSRDHPINTRNYLVVLDRELGLKASMELQLPPEWPAPKFDLVRGMEDSRLFEHDGMLWTISTVRELSEQGLCEQVVAHLDERVQGEYSNDWIVFESHQQTHEKNWMPWILDGEIQFVHRLGSMLKLAGGHGFYRDPKIDVSRISGGSQVIDADGTRIALVHEANFIPGRPNRFYQHRFVTFDDDGGMRRISRPFYFHDRQIEFAAGLAYFPEKRQLMASYGVRDCEAWLATMDLDQVLAFVEGS